MKKLLMVLSLAIYAACGSWADGFSVSVQNQERWRFWYVLDPPGFSDESPGSPWLALKAADYLDADTEDFPFALLESGAQIIFGDLSEGTHYVLGFFEDESLQELPVRLVALQADDAMGTRHYDLYSMPEILMAARGKGRLARFAIEEGTAVKEAATEEAAVEEALEVLASFSDSYDPVYFTRESREGFAVLPIASSRTWGKPGTRLADFSGLLKDGEVTLVLRSAAGFARNVSCFFYVFPTRAVGTASTYTFEARPDADGRAAVVLWQRDRDAPRIVGTASTRDGVFTWTARADELPPELAPMLGPATTFDLTTAWLDETSGTWEEFYVTTFAVADLTR